MKKKHVKELVDLYFKAKNAPGVSEGMEKLSDFCKSDSIRFRLKDDDEISGVNLRILLGIMIERDVRIVNTSRNYENDPDKWTNKFFQDLYNQLRVDLFNSKSTAEDSEDIKIIKKVLFTREGHHLLAKYVKDAKDGNFDAAFNLGIALATGKPIKNINPDQNVGTKFEWEGQSLTLVAQPMNKKEPIKTIPHELKLGHDLKNGLLWLEHGSKLGDQRCSFQLASYYSGNNELIPNSNPDRDKARYFLDKAANQGNEAAKKALQDGVDNYIAKKPKSEPLKQQTGFELSNLYDVTTLKKHHLQSLTFWYSFPLVTSGFYNPTQGMTELKNFLNSDSMKKLNANDEISGENLKNLLKIMEERESRIFNTTRSYENDPEKNTNKNYKALYAHLAMNLIQAKSSGAEADDIKEVFFTRASRNALAEYEKKANAKDVDAAFALGKALVSGKFTQQANELKVSETQLGTIKSESISWGNQSITIVSQPRNDGTTSIQTIPIELNVERNVEKGIQLLVRASELGDHRSSFQLANYYSGKEEIPNFKHDLAKAMTYLQKASDQGNANAQELLEKGGKFGKISIEAQEAQPQKGPSR